MGLISDVTESLDEHKIMFSNRQTAEEFIKAFSLEDRVDIIEKDDKFYIREVQK